MPDGGAEVGIHGGVGGAVSGDDSVLGEPDGESGGDGGVGCMGQVICIYPYVPLNSYGRRCHLRPEPKSSLAHKSGAIARTVNRVGKHGKEFSGNGVIHN